MPVLVVALRIGIQASWLRFQPGAPARDIAEVSRYETHYRR